MKGIALFLVVTVCGVAVGVLIGVVIGHATESPCDPNQMMSMCGLQTAADGFIGGVIGAVIGVIVATVWVIRSRRKGRRLEKATATNHAE